MTNLSHLKVSLTKHNAHKIAQLLKKYEADQVLTRLDEVQAEKAQTYKNLSVSQRDKIPEVWAKAKKLGNNAIDALVLVGIIFSHHKLINAMINASGRNGFSGRIEREIQLEGKEYTNFVRVIDQLGFATKLDYLGVTFNLKAMFEISGLGPLVCEVLGYKLISARWDRSGSIADEAIKLNFHKVFGISSAELKNWLSDGIQPKAAEVQLLPKDEEFFQEKNEITKPKLFEFRAGHTERSAEAITKSASTKTQISQLHNFIQNKLYIYLCDQLGKNCVGTEIDTGNGTTIDLATQYDNKTIFYEIKTSPSVRTSIRQAIPQLLEYAYWPDNELANELIIVSHLPITPSAELYLLHLRKKFNLPLNYRQFDLEKNQLV